MAGGCGGGDVTLPDTGGATSIRVVDGDGQRATVGEPLTAPVVVEVNDADGNPVEGVTVGFALTSAGSGAEITPVSAVTGADGRTQAHVLLGDKVGLQTGEARVMGDGSALPSTTFAALADAVTDGGGNPPSADFTWECDGLTCQFSDASTDDGTLTGWVWLFGDGTSSTARNPSHVYAAPGGYSVTLTVTDDQSESDIAAKAVTATAPNPPPPANDPPQAQFSVSCQDLTCSFTDQSTDGDGTIASRRYDFGDGASSTDRNPSHTYAAAGQYNVTLRVTDDDGADDAQTHTASPTAPPPNPNDPPRAEFEVTCQELHCTFVDRSQDPDGSLTSWAWDFGDGSTSTERNPSHTYAAAGRYTVLLVVTDNDGAADTKTHDANPTEPTPTNAPPQPDFDAHCDHGTCAFTDKSKDDDGAVVSWQWSFGDGSTSTEQNPVHTYAERGRYDVQLTVTDDGGATASKTKRVDVKR